MMKVWSAVLFCLLTLTVKTDGILRGTKITEERELLGHNARKILEKAEHASKNHINGHEDYCDFSVIAKGDESGLAAWAHYCDPTTTLQLCSSQSKCECMDSQVIINLVLSGSYPELRLALLVGLSSIVGRPISDEDLRQVSKLVFVTTDFDPSLGECRAVKDSLCVVSAPPGIPDVKCGSGLRCGPLPDIPPFLNVTAGHCVSGSGAIFLSWAMFLFSVFMYLISQ